MSSPPCCFCFVYFISAPGKETKTYFPANDMTWFFFIVGKNSNLHHIFFTPSSVVGYLGWFPHLAIMNSAVINADVQIAL